MPASLKKGVVFMSRASAVSMNKLPTDKMRECYAKEMLKSALTEPPEFRSLPGALRWPNPEVTLLVAFSTGLLQCACSVLGAYASGFRTTTTNLGLACGVISLILLFYAHQLYQLLVFYRVHNAEVWNDAELPESKDEVDDPFFALLTNVSCGRIKPTSRELGSFEAPENDDEEPARTERALARFFCFCRPWFSELPPGDALAELATWLGDASGSRRGIYYLFGMILLQLLMALLLGLCYAFPFSQTTVGGRFLLVCIALCQLVGAVWSQARTANDKIDGLEKTIVYTFEAASTVILLMAAFLPLEGQDGADVDLDQLAYSLQLSSISSTILIASIFIPMGITVYNSFIAPIVGAIWQADNNLREVGSQMFMTFILMPYEVATSFLGFGGAGAMADVVGEMEGSAVEMAGSTGSHRDLSKVLKFADDDGDGKLDFAEFCELVREKLPEGSLVISDAELRGRFDTLDQDGSGKVDAQDLRDMMNTGDNNGDSRLDFIEFCQLMRERGGDELGNDELRERFDMLDTDGSGKIIATEYLLGSVTVVTTKEGGSSTPTTAEQMIAQVAAAPAEETPAQAAATLAPQQQVAAEEAVTNPRMLMEAEDASTSEGEVDAPVYHMRPQWVPRPQTATVEASQEEKLNGAVLEKHARKKPMGKPSKGKLKRQKHEEFLQRVRAKRDARSAGTNPTALVPVRA